MAEGSQLKRLWARLSKKRNTDPANEDGEENIGDTNGLESNGLESNGIGSNGVVDSKDEKGDTGGEKGNGKKEKPPQVGIFELYKYTTKVEKILLLLAILAAGAHGATLPLFTVVFGNVIEDFAGRGSADVILDNSKWFAILGAISFILGYVQVFLFVHVANRQCTRIRRRYFRALMRQDFAWYDSNDSGELTTRVASDVDLIQSGVGEKVGIVVQFTCTFFTGFIIGFIWSWKMTLVILSVSPILVFVGSVLGKVTSDASGEGQTAYGEAGAVAFEALSMIRSVTAYGGQEEEARRYEEKLNDAYKFGVRRGHFTGLGMGITMMVMVCMYALSLWFGSRLVRDGELSTGDVITTFFAVVIGAFSLGQMAPGVTAIVTARGAAPRIYEIIARQSAIDPLAPDGKILDNVEGRIEFKNVSFAYARRPDQIILQDLNLSINPGATTALVGPSGCGKSTTVGLVERFYDVSEGAVLLDGVDVRTLNVQWLRSQIGYVSQQPSLFGLSVRENIALGAGLEPYVDPQTNETSLRRVEVSEDEVIEAAKLANAHSFIMKLPEGYSTVLGSGNSQLSGGQKQRVAIARALVRNPKILLLDEATSALDARSETVVQQALERAQQGRTTIVIAHRLSTVKNADTIAVVDEGCIVERGAHSELIEKPDGRYRKLVELQNISMKRQEEEEEASDGETLPQRFASFRSTDAGAVVRKKTSTLEASTSLVDKLDIEMEAGEEEKAIDRGVFRRTLRASVGELHFLLLGILGSAGAGAVLPMLGFIFAEIMVELQELEPGGDTGRISFLTLMLVALAGSAFISNYVMFVMNAISGERLTRKMRLNAFRAFMKQEVGFFDMETNEIGTLTSRLATEATDMKGLVGGAFGSLSQAVATILVGLIIALASCWRVALIVLAVLPAVAVGQAFQVQAVAGFDSDTKKRYAESGGTATEAVSNIRTVTSLGLQEYFCGIFNEQVNVPLRNGRRAAHIQGFFYGFADFSMFLIFFLAFWSGSKFMEKEQCDPLGVFRAILALIYGAFTFGQMSAFSPDFGASRVGATRIYRLLDRVSKIDPTSGEGQVHVTSEGRVDLQKVEFEYPRRPEIPVLRGMTAAVEENKVVALVGGSGSGKSTVVSLIERFYDPRVGDVLLDNKSLRTLNIQSARAHMSIVLQEAELFNRSIRDNIAYGFTKAEGTVVTEAQIIEAAKAANAHDFISNLPKGYDTLCGEKGGQLSGGQRQRIAIARSLVRNPRVLLLDEATSALDAKSESVVQEALDKAAEGRTTIIIAHRLSTIKDAGKICVVSRGKIVESGTHKELMARNRAYASLVRKQMTSVP